MIIHGILKLKEGPQNFLNHKKAETLSGASAGSAGTDETNTNKPRFIK